jgi:hypothetical protein
MSVHLFSGFSQPSMISRLDFWREPSEEKALWRSALMLYKPLFALKIKKYLTFFLLSK